MVDMFYNKSRAYISYRQCLGPTNSHVCVHLGRIGHYITQVFLESYLQDIPVFGLKCFSIIHMYLHALSYNVFVCVTLNESKPQVVYICSFQCMYTHN